MRKKHPKITNFTNNLSGHKMKVSNNFKLQSLTHKVFISHSQKEISSPGTLSVYNNPLLKVFQATSMTLTIK